MVKRCVHYDFEPLPTGKRLTSNPRKGSFARCMPQEFGFGSWKRLRISPRKTTEGALFRHSPCRSSGIYPNVNVIVGVAVDVTVTVVDYDHVYVKEQKLKSHCLLSQHAVSVMTPHSSRIRCDDASPVEAYRLQILGRLSSGLSLLRGTLVESYFCHSVWLIVDGLRGRT